MGCWLEEQRVVVERVGHTGMLEAVVGRVLGVDDHKDFEEFGRGFEH